MLKNWFKLLWCEIKVASPTALWLLPLFTVGGLILLLDTQADAPIRLEHIAVVVEIIFPLGIMFMANGLILHEREENTLAFVATRTRLTILWLRRLGALFLYATLWLGVLLMIYHFFYLPLHVRQMLIASLSVSFALVGVSSIAGLALKEINASYLIGTSWWAFCLISSKAAFTIFGPYLYLFYLWFSVREGIGTDVWFLNKLALTGVGFAFILISILLLRPTERFFAS